MVEHFQGGWERSGCLQRIGAPGQAVTLLGNNFTPTADGNRVFFNFHEAAVGPTIPDRLPMPLSVHGRQGSPCPRCGTALEAVFFEDYVVCYCPECQTGGKLLKDRRLSRLLK